MTERDEVLSILKREAHDLKDRFGVTNVGLFGSVVRDEAKDSSDLDLLIELDPESITYKKYLDLEVYLQSLFPRKIEIVTTDGVSPYILPYISREVVWV
ncbi:nucleotidyltransferase family protein [Methanospirillum sp. J.3.6.1-F.2.7.3]|jgi:predicted nucleotidyltransferase|uniref:protein adenylyltransferase n=1 Tax=Methanospirillum purgamenti TaxID=2834276 RepID=A0A8E7AV87_9EURY|nr:MULTISPECIES: nucleotidyltransferase family protein [Methanospirillum]MDX8551322.1 nucleotidyltransferase family protein [Methanospirillum hungatei]MDX8551329.1 nucleotidyltransferase family protein [Methanospirillum hungatei]QVV87905.1 nucleotidyltransferase family protein [Methanospirillum sp. J.3.6.1-F.2.7.3]QVV87913.1 nucleotidyltransferase family protein [Methanospirillum sp. J.3.6.1-F.2.7.3]